MKYLVALALAAPIPTVSAAETAPNWGEVLKTDAKFFRDELRANHPGYVDPLNPGFRPLVERGYDLAVSRAKSADDFADYWWAMREYSASFDDGHLSIGFTDTSPSLPTSWPGFLTRNRDDKHTVATLLPGGTVPPAGAELISCDGLDAKTLAARNLGPFYGMWNLASQREALSWLLFLDQQNPHIRRPDACVFKVEGQERSYKLDWRPLSEKEMMPHIRKASEAFRAPVQARWHGGDGYWISFGTFAQSQDLPVVTQRIDRERERLRQAGLIVFDLRGNTGGSSDWSMRVAQSLWGEAWTEAKRPHPGEADWRVSPAVIEGLQSHVDHYRQLNNAVMVERTEKQIKEMRAALAARRSLWQETFPQSRRDPAAKPQTDAKIFVLTDSGCLSACLDALDLWKSLGAIQVGRETSADTFYIQVRRGELPSKLALFLIPQKVWRNRPRGSNEPHVPQHVYEGDMANTAALEEWISKLAIQYGVKPARQASK